MNRHNSVNNDSASADNSSASNDDSSIDQISDIFHHMTIRDDPALILQYKMLAFIYNKNYINFVHLARVWEEFRVKNSDVEFTAMELKLEFCLRILANIDNFDLLSYEHKKYFKARIFNQNAEELLKNCDLEYGDGGDLKHAENTPVFLPFDAEEYNRSVNLFGKECQTGPVPIKNIGKETEQHKTPFIQLLASVFFEGKPITGNPVDAINARIKEGFEQKMDFNEYLRVFLQRQEASAAPPPGQDSQTAGPSVSEQNIETPNLSEISHISMPADETVGPNFSRVVASTPVTSRPNTRSRSLPRSQQENGGRSNVDRNRTTSADRAGENLQRFANRLKARSKPRHYPRL